MQKNDTYSDFWLDDDILEEYISNEKNNSIFFIDLIKLSSYRRAISNYVSILTNKNIPVQFIDIPDKEFDGLNTGKIIKISASVKRKKDFDWCVGLALHEASHSLLSDWDVFKTLYGRIPRKIIEKSEKKNLTRNRLEELSKFIFNVIEDRYVDNYVFENSPGYRGYYESLYEKVWNSKDISKILESDLYRLPNLISYEYRIVNLTNPSTDLDALSGLREISNIIGLSNLDRLSITKDRLSVAFDVVDKILDNIQITFEPNCLQGSNGTIEQITNVIDKFFESSNEKTKGSGSIINPISKEKDDNLIQNVEEEKFIDNEDQGEDESLSDNEIEEIKENFERQKDIIKHNYRNIKDTVNSLQKSILDIIEQSGIVLVPTGTEFKIDNCDGVKVDCVVVNKLTKELISAGEEVFPLAKFRTELNIKGILPIKEYEEAVNDGFKLGKILGKKLKVRGETNIIKYMRKSCGKVERRLLSDIGAGLENIFSSFIIEKYNRLRMHLSVDASSSMQNDKKWIPTLTCLTAICVAASSIENLKISVSLRSTHNVSINLSLPYIVKIYDSEIDKISKVRNLFPFLHPCGSTPEGLAFEAVLNNFIIGKQFDDQDNYFINISDGEPWYEIDKRLNESDSKISYSGDPAVKHTRRQIEKIEKSGVKVLSYFIETEGKNNLKDQFKTMYGQNSRFIDVINVSDISKTINELFLSRE